ncbi:MAG: DUF3301 domain-containing protein [Vibrio sp.]
MLIDLLLILVVVLVCALFWQQRKQSELARKAIEQKCNALSLQLLSTSLHRYSFRLPNGKFGFHAMYQFEFSVTGDDYYQARLLMQHGYPKQFFIPPYRLVD